MFVNESLTWDEKHQVCLDLLTEFGAQNVREHGDEIIHSCLLPFGRHPHGDRNPSASINVEKLAYNCFICGGGGLAWLVATLRGTGYGRAKVWVEGLVGEGGVRDSDSMLRVLERIFEVTAKAPQIMPRYAQEILDGWRFIHPYLTEFRNIRAENIVAMSAGWDPSADAIVIPHFWEGNLVGWQQRRLGGTGPKYLSTPDFPRDRTIYNYNPRSDVVLVESPMSVMARCHQTHLEATFGAEVTERQRELIAAHRGRVVLWFDNDRAGWGATRQVGAWLSKRGPVWAVQNPYDADPADLDDDTFARLLDEAVVPWVLWARPTEFVPWEHPMKKYGTGKVIRDDEAIVRAAASDDHDRAGRVEAALREHEQEARPVGGEGEAPSS